MNKNTVKIVIAIVLLAVAGFVLVTQLGGGGGGQEEVLGDQTFTPEGE